MTCLVSLEISESAGTPACFGFYIARLGKSNRFRKAKSASRAKAKLYEGGAALSYGDFFILRTEGLKFAHRVDSFIAAPVIVRPLPPRHSREIPPPFPRNPPSHSRALPPSFPRKREATRRRTVSSRPKPSAERAPSRPCGRDALAPKGADMPHTLSQCAHLPPSNSARLWTTRATRNGASPKTALPLSMGPTPFSVGYPREGGEHRRRRGASMERFAATAADAFLPSVNIDGDVELQWGQRLSALDTNRSDRRALRHHGASMGPTPFRNPRHAEACAAGAGKIASMGPTPFSVGYGT